jgi:hypothetical protein
MKLFSNIKNFYRNLLLFLRFLNTNKYFTRNVLNTLYILYISIKLKMKILYNMYDFMKF